MCVLIYRKRTASRCPHIDFCKPGGFARICMTDLQTPFRFAWLDLQLCLRFTRVQIYKFWKRQGLALICNFWESEVHIDLQQNSHFFKRKWKRFEATLHLLIIWKKHRERSQKRSLIFERITLQAKRQNWKHYYL